MMSKSVVAVALLIAGVLGVVAALVMTGPGGGGGSPDADGGADGNGEGSAVTAGFDIDAGAVEAVFVRGGDGAWRGVRRGEGAGWVYVEGGVDVAGEARGWPANGPAIRSALSALEGMEITGEGGDVGEGATEVRLVMRGSGARTLRVAGEAAGGNVLVEVDGGAGGSGVVRRGLLAGVLDEGPASWRLERALPGVSGVATSRVTIEGVGGDRLGLDRLDGRWYVRTPVRARASADAAAGMLDALGGLRVVSFVGADALEMGVGGWRVVAERDERRVEGERVAVETERVEAVFGAPAPYGVGARYARVTLPDGTEHGVVVNLGVLGDLAGLVEPRGYLARTPTGERAADVQFVTVSSVEGEGGADEGYRRRLGTWHALLADGGDEPVDSAARERLERVLGLLTAGGERVGVGLASEAGARTPIRVSLRDLSGDVVDVLRVGYSSSGTVVVRNGAVVWDYGAMTGAGSDAEVIADFAGLPAFEELGGESVRPDPVGLGADGTAGAGSGGGAFGDGGK